METDTKTVTKNAPFEMGRKELISVNSSNNNGNEKVLVKDIKPELERSIEQNQLADAWNKYKAFEDYKNNEVMPLPLSEFISEWSARLNSAVAAGCEYSDTVLAFKLMDRVNLDGDAVRQVLDRYSTDRYKMSKFKNALISIQNKN
jgi:hypothetical protein